MKMSEHAYLPPCIRIIGLPVLVIAISFRLRVWIAPTLGGFVTFTTACKPLLAGEAQHFCMAIIAAPAKATSEA